MGKYAGKYPARIDGPFRFVTLLPVMGRRPIFEKAMTDAERKRRARMLATPLPKRVARIQRAFESAGADAQALFIDWLEKMRFISPSDGASG